MKTVLLVDDNAENRYLLRMLLGSAGYDVAEAANGAEALETARANRPALVISDILMPQMDGFALCRAFKRDEQLRDIPFVFYTATYTDRRDEELALQLGAARFIVKPMDNRVFLAAIDEVMAEHASGRLAAAAPPPEEEEVFYRLYNAALVRKLEDKRIELERANRELEESREQFRRLAENAPDMIFRFEWRPRRGFVYVNAMATLMTGYTPEEYYAEPDLFERLIQNEDGEAWRFNEESVINLRQPLVCCWRRKDGGLIWVEQHLAPILDAQGKVAACEGIVCDITERRRAESEREKLRVQLAQLQKMESIGRLAAGVAHDFNNMLSVIMGYVDLASAMPEQHAALQGYLHEIRETVARAAGITRQLLAFSRKQSASPRVLDLNAIVAGMLKFLRRLIGEDIILDWMPDAKAWPVLLDPAQLDQLLANLVVNARDAIAGAGHVVIETHNVVLDENYCAQHPGVKAGDYVMLAVSDNGCGMTAATLSHIFEPFFTTKAEGRGTGLGLATVYGIVRQNNGFVNVYSEAEKGTTFKIYLPRYGGAVDGETNPDQTDTLPHGTGETILVVEDDAEILKVGREMLEKLGYHVLAAATPAIALEHARRHAGKIRLLIVDLVLPQMSAEQLVQALREFMPELKVLFVSGYPLHAAAGIAKIEMAESFLQKPFSFRELALKIQQALQHGTGTTAAG